MPLTVDLNVILHCHCPYRRESVRRTVKPVVSPKAPEEHQAWAGAQVASAKGAEWGGLWDGCPLPSRLVGLGELRELPQRGPGRITRGNHHRRRHYQHNVELT